MGRPRIKWNDAQLLAIINGIAALDRDFPRDNARFLDGLIAEVRAITGRVFGATTYSRLLRNVAPQAILRAQALAPMAQQASADSRPVDLELMRQALAAVVREALAPWYASQRERGDGHAGGAAPDRAELAWLSPARFAGLLSALGDASLGTLRQRFDAMFPGTGELDVYAWFPAWLLVVKPALTSRLGEARVQRDRAAARARAAGGNPASGARRRPARTGQFASGIKPAACGSVRGVYGSTKCAAPMKGSWRACPQTRVIAIAAAAATGCRGSAISG
ncbi:hypothetical protein [Paraburkholderia xenovorans]|uniref:hypothetical protein n=1 Tax=Paraburkholderia xenovorans TaxID=36873 RepID=UPI0020A670A7|nr:hypothetical protein [Paraburkholderia xenovorans]